MPQCLSALVPSLGWAGGGCQMMVKRSDVEHLLRSGKARWWLAGEIPNKNG